MGMEVDGGATTVGQRDLLPYTEDNWGAFGLRVRLDEIFFRSKALPGFNGKHIKPTRSLGNQLTSEEQNATKSDPALPTLTAATRKVQP